MLHMLPDFVYHMGQLWTLLNNASTYAQIHNVIHSWSLLLVMYSNGVDSNGVAEAFPMDLRVVCQLSEACFSLPAAAIVGPDERSRLYPRVG